MIILNCSCITIRKLLLCLCIYIIEDQQRWYDYYTVYLHLSFIVVSLLAVANFLTIKQSDEFTWFPLSRPCGFFSFSFLFRADILVLWLSFRLRILSCFTYLTKPVTIRIQVCDGLTPQHCLGGWYQQMLPSEQANKESTSLATNDPYKPPLSCR